jgi:kynureninase
MTLTRNLVRKLDQEDLLSAYQNEFYIADKELCYLDGNSLGRLPLKTIEKIDLFLKDEWGSKLVEGWEKWIKEAQISGDLLAESILGANCGEVLICDTTSVNFFQLCSAVVTAYPTRKTIITDAANFPTDRYILEGIANEHGLKLIIIDNEDSNSKEYERITLEYLEPYLSEDVSLVTFQVLQYRSGALNPIKDITKLVNQYGALTVWDASHAAGSVKLDFEENNIDLAVGCTYKYLCSGPGSPAWLYVRKSLQERLQVPIQGWFAQNDQFEMGPEFLKSPNIRGFQIASPSIIGLRCVNVFCEMVKQAKIEKIIEKAQTGTDLMIQLYDEWLKDLGFHLMTSRDSEKRGGHISLMHEHAKTISVSLREFERVIVDYRVPDQIRIAISPLAMSYNEIYRGMKKIRDSVARKDYLKIKNKTSEVT